MPVLLAAGSADPDSAHAPNYGWAVAVGFGLVVVALVAWSAWLRYGGSRSTDHHTTPADSRGPVSSEDTTGALHNVAGLPEDGQSEPQPEPTGRRTGWRGLLRTYRPAVPPRQVGSFPTEQAAEARAHRLDEQYADHLNQYEGFFEVVADGDRYRVVERRGRKMPRGVPGSWTGGLGP